MRPWELWLKFECVLHRMSNTFKPWLSGPSSWDVCNIFANHICVTHFLCFVPHCINSFWCKSYCPITCSVCLTEEHLHVSLRLLFAKGSNGLFGSRPNCKGHAILMFWLQSIAGGNLGWGHLTFFAHFTLQLPHVQGRCFVDYRIILALWCGSGEYRDLIVPLRKRGAPVIRTGLCLLHWGYFVVHFQHLLL